MFPLLEINPLFPVLAAGSPWWWSVLFWAAVVLGVLVGLLLAVAAWLIIGAQPAFRIVSWILFPLFYRVRVRGLDRFPEEGGALVVSNHLTWIDGFFLLMTIPRTIRAVAYAGNFTNPFLHWLALRCQMILLGRRPKELARSLEAAREAIREGDAVFMFPEGGISRTGQLQGFRPGLLKILHGTTAPVVPVYLDELWGSLFSFDRRNFLWKWPRQWRHPVTIQYGVPVAQPCTVHAVRQAVQRTGAESTRSRSHTMLLPIQRFIRCAKQRLTVRKVADSLGTEMTGGETLMRALILRRILEREVLTEEDRRVGILLPPSAGGVLANLAVALDRRVSVNLNYTLSPSVLQQCLEMAGLKKVLTSRRFLAKAGVQLGDDVEAVFVEDLREKATTWDIALTWMQTNVWPASWLEASLGLSEDQADDVLTIIFTSGTTGTPKGVMLSNANVASNIDAIDQLVHLTSTDTIIGILPFFHSFGYTVTLWTVMGLDIAGVYHFNPLDAKQVGKLCKDYQATVLLSTPTFLRSYIRRTPPEHLETLDVVVVGAERLPKELADAFEERFGARPVEGYGITELSPLVSANVPPTRSFDNFQPDSREGTVGRPAPGIATRVVDLDTGEELEANQQGMLEVSGPNVMVGYLDRPDLTGEVIRDGWYTTGDMALIDDDGFIKITGRLSRFSKIGGEMVPHVKVEESMVEVLEMDEEDDIKFAVASVPDPKRGERLVVLHTGLKKRPDEISAGLRELGLPNIFIPDEQSYFQIEDLPVLGTGKTDLKAIQKLAREKAGVEEPAT